MSNFVFEHIFLTFTGIFKVQDIILSGIGVAFLIREVKKGYRNEIRGSKTFGFGLTQPPHIFLPNKKAFNYISDVIRRKRVIF